MSDMHVETRLESGLLQPDDDVIAHLPESPGHYRLLSSGQRIMLVGHAGEEGLREAVRQVVRHAPAAGVGLLEYSTSDSPQAAVAAAQDEVARFKPLYNEGFGRFRNTEISLPKKGHRIRKAMQNP